MNFSRAKRFSVSQIPTLLLSFPDKSFPIYHKNVKKSQERAGFAECRDCGGARILRKAGPWRKGSRRVPIPGRGRRRAPTGLRRSSSRSPKRKSSVRIHGTPPESADVQVLLFAVVAEAWTARNATEARRYAAAFPAVMLIAGAMAPRPSAAVLG